MPAPKNTSAKKSVRNKSNVGGVKPTKKLSWQLGFMSVLAVVVVGLGVVFVSQAASPCYQFRVGPKLKTTKSTCVSYAQGLLNYKMFGKNTSRYLKADGYYGAKTRDVLKIYQVKNGLKTTDGRLDSYTWASLCYYKGTPTSAYKLYFKAADCSYWWE